MGRFLEQQKTQQSEWRKTAGDLSPNAQRGQGEYRKNGKNRYEFCLPLALAEENIYGGFRDEALDYFTNPPGPLGGKSAIPWHAGHDGKPSTHLCDSQVCCVNFLFPLRDNVEGATMLLRRAFPDCRKAVPVQPGESGLVEFEWLGDPDIELLDEGRYRTRGANATSCDAAMCYEDADGRRHLVLIEWKYTESYSPSERLKSSKFSSERGGAKRRSRYQARLESKGSPVDMTKVALDDLGYEPFYQFARQQLLGAELAGDYDGVALLHISPGANHDFERVTPQRLRERYPKKTACQVWGELVRAPHRFVGGHTEDLFGGLVTNPPAGLQDWARYIRERYTSLI